MIQLGVSLMVVALLAAVLPLIDRQFALVVLLRALGLGSFGASALLFIVGAAVTWRAVAQVDRGRMEPAEDANERRQDDEPKNSVALYLLGAAAFALAVYASAPSGSEAPPYKMEPVRTFGPAHVFAASFQIDGPEVLKKSEVTVRFTKAGALSDKEASLHLVVIPESPEFGTDGSVVRALFLAKPKLCGPTGLLARYNLGEVSLTLYVEEDGKQIGLMPVPSRLCDDA